MQVGDYGVRMDWNDQVLLLLRKGGWGGGDKKRKQVTKAMYKYIYLHKYTCMKWSSPDVPQVNVSYKCHGTSSTFLAMAHLAVNPYAVVEVAPLVGLERDLECVVQAWDQSALQVGGGGTHALSQRIFIKHSLES